MIICIYRTILSLQYNYDIFKFWKYFIIQKSEKTGSNCLISVHFPCIEMVFPGIAAVFVCNPSALKTYLKWVACAPSRQTKFVKRAQRVCVCVCQCNRQCCWKSHGAH